MPTWHHCVVTSQKIEYMRLALTVVHLRYYLRTVTLVHEHPVLSSGGGPVSRLTRPRILRVIETFICMVRR